MKAITSVLIATALLAMPVASMAAPIDGELGIGGQLNPTCSGGEVPCTMDLADGVTFAASGGGNEFLVSFATGDFAAAGLMFGDIGTINDFMFDPLTPSPVDPLWSIGGFSFVLESLVIVDQDLHFLELSGSGTVKGAGFDDTLGRWTLSADDAGMGLNFSWSSTTVAPEPGILVLLGMGLIGVFGARRLARS